MSFQSNLTFQAIKTFLLMKIEKFAMSTFFRFVLVVFAVLFSLNRGLAVTYTVSSETEFNALPNLNAGDIIKIQSGTSGSINRLSWVCPSNVTDVQVECWGGGGAGGSAYKPASGLGALGGGGAGGAYAKTAVPVLPGNSYTINVGAGGVTSITDGAKVPGGDSWFGSSSVINCLAKGGEGGESVVSSRSGIIATLCGTGGAGSSEGSLGDAAYKGGNGAGASNSANTGGGGGSSAGTSSAGSNADSYLGALAVPGGGAGGNGKNLNPGSGLSGGSPGGGGGGARGTGVGTQYRGGAGGTGQIILLLINNKANPVISQAPVATAIGSGETLASSLLSGGTANVPGTFSWTSPSTMPGVTGNQSVTFTPTDSANYNSVSLLVNVLVKRTYIVSNETEFNALPSLNAGDIVKMQNGTYGSVNKNIISTIDNDDLAKANPIQIYAVNPGGVIVNAPSFLLFSGRGIIFAGVDFGSGCGQLSTNGDIIRADYGSKYITFSHLRFTGCGSTNSSGNDVHWIRLSGFNNTIEYCSFNERPESSSNATVWICPGINEGGIDVPRNHWIHHCYFGTRYVGTVNGCESIRLGAGDIQTFDVRAVVEKNVFYHSIWRTDGTSGGEPEIISNKTKGNIIRNNTILESQGGICLRTGQYCTVEGNFIFGAGSYSGNSIVMGNPNVLQRGIRVIGKNHIIRNNYVANVTGTLAAAALCVMSGESNYYEGDPANSFAQTGDYLPADNAQIYNNTFINCAEMNLSYLAPESYGAPASPTGVKIYNNAWQGNGSASSAVVLDTTSLSGSIPAGYTPIVLGGSGGNYIYETSSSKYGWNGLGGTYSASVSPVITETLVDYKIPTSSSPLLGTADATLCATTDIRGFTRPASSRDIGCYERDATGTTAYAPMLRNEVGAVFDGGPSSSLWKVPFITSSLTASAYRTIAFNYFITAGNGATSFDANDLPSGLSVNKTTGEISGIPTGVAGTYNVTLVASNTDGSVSAPLTIQLFENVSTYQSSTSWVCPNNVTAVQVECWGGGGAGGSGYKPSSGSGNALGGGGAGGAYAKRNFVAVVPGNSYTINVGAGGVSSIMHLAAVSGEDSWFGSSSSTSCLAKGGAGGQSVISSGSAIVGSGGVGYSSGSMGDIVYQGGNGAGASNSALTGGGGGSSAGTSSAGSHAVSYLGASAVSGGGVGGNGKDLNPGNGFSGGRPGGGGGGARGTGIGTQSTGGIGGSGQVILTLINKLNSTISISGGTFTYSSSPQGPGLENVTKTGSADSNLTCRYEGVAPTVYPASSTRPTEVGTYSVTATVPEDSNFASAISSPTPFTIVPATPTFTQSPSASTITYGQTLASSVLSGTASVPGAWSWANGAQILTAGISVQTATFTPSDLKNYTTTTANVSVTVNQGIPIISLPVTGAITLTYGQALNFFNWSSWNSGSDGVLTWVDPNLIPGLGDSSQSVLFTPTDMVNYTVVNSIVTVRVSLPKPVISQAPVTTAIAIGETLASSLLSGGVADVPGTFAWTSINTMPGVTGTQSVTFTPTDSVNYSSVPVLVNVVVTEPFRQGSWVNLADDGRLLYKRDDLGNRIPDFTACGYKAGKEGIPYVPTRVIVKPGDGDDRALIQAAIDRVAALTPDANGFRGAVLLTAGEYQVSGPLLISTSGVVLRGVGESETEGTRLKSTDRSGIYLSNETILLEIQGSGSATGTGTAQAITSPYVPAGSSSFEVASAFGFSVGSEVRVYRPGTTGWITAIGMDQLSANDNGIDNRWKPPMRDLYWHRTIQRIEGNRIFLDAPITTAIDQAYGGGTVQKYTFAGRIEKCGVEDIRGLSSYDETKRDSAGNYIDEAHAWTFIEIESAQNCWVRRVTSRYFAYSCVSLEKGAKWVSVLNCQSLDPVSVVDGGRRYAFNIDDCELCLVKDCTNDSDRHQFVTHSNTSGPNAFVNGTSTRAFSECGPHHEWANGILWDRITVSGSLATFAIRNRGNAGSGHGWAAANSLAWNCAAPEFDVENPPTARNWMIGCVGIRDTYNSAAVPANPDFATDDSHGANVFPVSLLGSQRQDTMGTPGSQIREYVVGDFDGCTPSGSTGDSVSVDSTWLSAITTLSSIQIGKMDDTRTGKWIPWTHNFTLDSGDTILSATLWVGLRSTGTGWTDDVIYLDSPTQPVSLSSLGASLTGTSTSVVRLDLGPYLAALSDGQLNLALSGDTALDWSMLELRVASSSVSSGSLTTLTPEADSTVDAANPTGNFGTSGSLATLANVKTSYLRWNLQGVSGKITRARVRLVPSSAGATAIENYAALAGNGWEENTIQYANQPVANGPMVSWKVRNGQAVEFDVTREAQEALTADGKLSLQIGSARSIGSSGTVTYASREGGQPQLILTTTAGNTAPTIASSGDQFVAGGSVIEPVVLGVADAESPATGLVVSASSSNASLVPNDSAHLTLGGVAGVRSLQITPVPGATGTATITVTVSDGALSSSTTFVFGVRNAPVLSWPSNTSNPLMYGTPATTSNVLKATSSVPGSFVYDPANGSILPSGNNQVVATFTPTDTINYLSGTITNTVLVLPAFVFLSAGSTNWVCPSNVTAVQVEAWGAGGAGGSASRTGNSGTVQYGGGGAGGAYAKKLSYPVVPGNTYYINAGACASNTNSVTGVSVSGGDSWFSSSNAPSGLILAKGGAGGNSAIGNTPTTAYATGGIGTTIGSIGNVLYAGGSGANASQTTAVAGTGAGGGGSGAGPSANGTTTTTCFGATAPIGGGNGGTGATTNSWSGTNGFTPGGGGGGSRNSSGTLTAGASGGAGQVIVLVKTITANLTLGDLAQTYDGNPKSATVTTDPANLNTVVTYNGSTSLPTAGGSYAVVATINENSYSGSVSGTLVIAKISQTITFGLNSATAKVGDAARTLIATSSSGLPVTLTSLNPNVATITSGNTLNIVGVGTATITATQAGNSSYEAATDVSVILTVSAAPGTTFASWSGGSATMTSPLLLQYALGGSSSSTGVSEATTSSLGATTFTMTAVVRTDDLKLSIVPKATTSLSATWDYSVTTTGKSDGVSQAGVGTGCERKVFTVSRASNSKIFMKFEVSYTP